MKTIDFANICSQILTTASQICVKIAEVALTWSMDTAVCVLRDTQERTAKQVRSTVIRAMHSFIHSLKHSFVRAFVRSFVRPFVHSSIVCK